MPWTALTRVLLSATLFATSLLYLTASQQGRAETCETIFQQGVAHYRQQRFDDAVIAFRSAAECEASSGHRSGLPDIALAEAYAGKGDDNRALENYETALKIRPDDVEVIHAAASLYLRHEMNEKAAALIRRLIELRPNDAQAHADLGAVYAASGKMAEAEEQFRTALKLDPKQRSATAGLGSLWLRTERVTEAIPLLKRACELAPDSYQPHYMLGTAYSRLGDDKDAADELEKALARTNSEPEIYYRLAQVYSRLGRADDSRQALARFSGLKAESEGAKSAKREAALLLAKAKPFVDSGNLKAAIDLLEKAWQLDSQNDQILFRLGGLYYDAAQYNSARECVRQAIAIAPSDWRYHYLSGLIEKDSGNPVRARAGLETAIRLNPAAADAYNQLGDLAMRDQRPNEAIGYFEQAARIDPAQAAYKLNLEAARRAAHK